MTDLEKAQIDCTQGGSEMELCELESSNFTIPYSLRVGLITLLSFVTFFTILIAIREVLEPVPKLFQFFANIFLAGTIICGIYISVNHPLKLGGGYSLTLGYLTNRPVMIPLLAQYVVETGFVTPRNFLVGLVKYSPIHQ